MTFTKEDGGGHEILVDFVDGCKWFFGREGLF